MEHTKGEWLMNVTKKFVNNKGLAITDESGRLICEVSHDLLEMPISEYEANANLIAAAPDLLRACIMSRNAIATLAQTSEPAKNCLEALEHTIKKARNE